MSNFDGLIFLTQLQQNSRLADVRDGIDHVHAQLNHLHHQQAQAAQAQQRLDYLREEIFTFANNIQSASQNLNQTAGLACYWCFRFLLWVAREGVGTQSFTEYQDKHIFDQALKRTHEVLNYSAQHFYTQDELIRIERLAFLDGGMWGRHKAYLHWHRIKAIAQKSPFLFSCFLTSTGIAFLVSFVAIFLVSAFYFMRHGDGFPVLFVSQLVGMFGSLILTPILLVFRQIPLAIKRRIVQKNLVPLATESGGCINERITLSEIKKLISNLKAELQNTWGNNIQIYDSLEEIERYHQALTDEYWQTKEQLIDRLPRGQHVVYEVKPPPLPAN